MTDILTHHIQKLGFDVTYNRIGEKYLSITNSLETHCFVIHCVKQTLIRIPYQTEILAGSFDHVTVFAQKKHQTFIENLLPEDVGLVVVDLDDRDNLMIVRKVGSVFDF